MRTLRKSWDALCGRTGLSGAAGLWRELAGCYSEPHRAYHDLRHLEQVIGLLEQLGAPDTLLLAAWFHDAVYRPGSPANEADSAALAADRLGACGYPAAAVPDLRAAILATATHRPDLRFDALLDADLAILGAAPDAYAAYREAIRKEYVAVPDQAFHAGRLAFVRSLLARPAIYQTAHCRGLFEAAARRNLAAERGELEALAGEATPCS